MKNYRNTINYLWQVVVLAVLSLSSCEEYPQYEFIDSSLPNSAFETESQGLQVTFVNNSAHATTYFWDFGDGQTSTEVSPVHTYSSKNVYTVSLVAADNNEEQASYSVELPVGFPVAGYTAEVDRSTVAFTNTSDNANSFQWDFGDGNSSTEENPVHVYDAKGTYVVKLTASDGTDANEYEESIFVPGKLVPEFVAPSFEIASYRSDWDWNGASSSGAPAPPDGSRGCKFGPDDWIGQTLLVDPNETYTLKFWFVTKSTSLPIGAKVLIEDAQDPNIVLLDTSTGPSASSEEYEEISFTFNTDSSSSITVKILYGDGEVRLDLFSIE